MLVKFFLKIVLASDEEVKLFKESLEGGVIWSDLEVDFGWHFGFLPHLHHHCNNPFLLSYQIILPNFSRFLGLNKEFNELPIII